MWCYWPNLSGGRVTVVFAERREGERAGFSPWRGLRLSEPGSYPLFVLHVDFLQIHFVINLVELSVQDHLYRVDLMRRNRNLHQQIKCANFNFSLWVVHQRAHQRNNLLERVPNHFVLVQSDQNAQDFLLQNRVWSFFHQLQQAIDPNGIVEP